MKRIVHITGSLDRGGAEAMLLKMSCHLATHFEQHVISLSTLGPLAETLQSNNIPVTALGMHENKLRAVWHLFQTIRHTRPHILQGWSHHSDFLALIMGKILRVPHCFWNIRCSDVAELGFPKLLKTLTWLSPFPDGVIVNSHAGLKIHQDLGYRPKAWHLIGNGFDTQLFCPSPEKRSRIRQLLGLRDEDLLIGLIARFDPMKDHKTFFQAVARLPHGTCHILLAGRGCHQENSALTALIPNHLKFFVHLMGEDKPVDHLMAALDVAVLSSNRSEGLPNAIGEAMSCGVPCVVTDVGDCRHLVESTGLVVPPEQVEALSQALLELLQESPEGRRQRGNQARAFIEKNYEIRKIGDLYRCLYEETS